MPTKKQILQVQVEKLRLRLKNPIPKYLKVNGMANVPGGHQDEGFVNFSHGYITTTIPSNIEPFTPEKWNAILNNSNKVIHEVKFKK